MEDFSSQIEQMLRQRLQSGPQLMRDQQSALETANLKGQQSIDELRSVYSNPANFEQSKWGALGLGLMAPTRSGNFSEGMYNGLAAATAAQNANREANLGRMEKLARLTELEGVLARQKATDQRTLYDTQGGIITNGMADQGALYDMGLGDQQLGSRPLQPGEEGPVAPDQSPEGQAELLYSDYMRNPQKYSGPQGQAMVKSAILTLNNARSNATRMQIAQSKADKPYAPDAGSRKQIREIEMNKAGMQDSLNNLDRAYELSGEGVSNSGYGARARAGVAEYLPDWMVPDAIFGSPEQGRNTAELSQIMDMEAIKGVGQYLKGPTSDRDVKLMLDTLSDPNATAERKQAAVDRVRTRIKLELVFNEELQRELKTGAAYEEGGGIPPELRDWVEEQITGGADPTEVMKVLQEQLGAGAQ